MTKLTNPYPKVTIGSAGSLRISMDVPIEDVNAIRSVRLDFGTVTLITKLFIKHIADQCRAQQWSVADRETFENYVNNLLTNGNEHANNTNPNLQRSTESIPARQRSVDDDRRRTKGIRRAGASALHKPTVSGGEQAGESVDAQS